MWEKVILGISERPIAVVLLALSFAFLFLGTTRLQKFQIVVKFRILLNVAGLVVLGLALFLIVLEKVAS